MRFGRASAAAVLMLSAVVGPLMTAGSSSAGPAPPGLSYLAPGYISRQIPVTLPPGTGVGGLVVRADGSLILWPINADGTPWDNYLHLVPATGGVVGAGDRFGPVLPSPVEVQEPNHPDFRSLAIAGGVLWALGSDYSQGGSHPDQAQLWELDLGTGRLISSYWIAYPRGDGGLSAQQIASDPQHNAVLVIDNAPGWSPSQNSVSVGSPRFAVVDIHADGSRDPLFEYDATGDTYPRSVAVTPDGTQVLLAQEGESGAGGSEVPDRNFITYYDRGGNFRTSQPVPWPDRDPPTDTPVAMAYPSGSCMTDTLFYGVDDASAETPNDIDLFSVSHPSPGSTNSAVAAPAPDSGAPPGYSVLLADQPGGGLVLAAWSKLVWIGCRSSNPAPVSPVHSPLPAPAPAGAGPSGYPSTGPVPSGGSSTGSVGLPGPSGPSPAPAVQNAPAPAGQPAAQPGLSAGSQGAAQASASPNLVGMADVRGDEPAMALPAVGLPAPIRSWAAELALTAGAGAIAFLAVIRPQRRLGQLERRHQ